MAQIVPRYLYPHVETYVVDKSIVTDENAGVDNSVKLCYVVTAPSGKDNLFVKFTTRAAAETLMGQSNFKLYGQPYMQALADLDHDNASVWIMRVMPENATYANAAISVYTKIDSENEYADPHKRKFRIKFTSKNIADATTKDELFEGALEPDGALVNGKYVDGEGYTQTPFFVINSAGRGSAGNLLSLRLSQNYEYEKEFGITMYNFEVLNFDAGLTLMANYVGGITTSPKYIGEGTVTLVDDVISEATAGTYPLEVKVYEDNVNEIYEAYVAFLKEMHEACTAEYEDKVVTYDIPEEVIDGTVPPTDEQKEHLAELTEILEIIEATAETQIPDVDEFDLIFGKKVAETSVSLPCIKYVEKLTDDIDITADDYDPNDYTESDIVDLSVTEGLTMVGGGNGYFDNPRVVENYDGSTTAWTKEDEVNYCYKQAFSGVYDKRILSVHQLGVTKFFDANYDFSVKQVLADLVLGRDDCPVSFDAGIIKSLSSSLVKHLANKYAEFNDKSQSIDIQCYEIREPSTLKKVTVTSSYWLSQKFIDHVTIYGAYIPLVKKKAILDGYVRGSVYPLVNEFEAELSEELYKNRFNYYECVGENVFRRATQSTRYKYESDLLEENNMMTFYDIKRTIEDDANDEIYNFADETVRNDFCTVENAKFAALKGKEVLDINIYFSTTKYEHDHSILHLYLDVTFRGLTKRVINEITINKRQYSSSSIS